MRFTDHVPRFLEVAPRDREVAEAAGVRDGRREFGGRRAADRCLDDRILDLEQVT